MSTKLYLSLLVTSRCVFVKMEFFFEEDNVFMNGIVGIVRNLAEPLHREDEEVERQRQVRNENYVEQTVANYSDFQFRLHFRMSRQTFEVNILKYLYFGFITILGIIILVTFTRNWKYL